MTTLQCDICTKDLTEHRNGSGIPEWYGEESTAHESQAAQEFMLICESCKVTYFADRYRRDIDSIDVKEMHVPTSDGDISVYDYHTKELIFPKHVNGRDASKRFPINDDKIKNLKRTADGYSKLKAFW